MKRRGRIIFYPYIIIKLKILYPYKLCILFYIYIYIKLFSLIISLKLYFKVIRELCYNDSVYSLSMDVAWLHRKPSLSKSYSHSATPIPTGCQKQETILLPQEASQKVVKTGHVALMPSCPSLRNENCNPLYSVVLWS